MTNPKQGSGVVVIKLGNNAGKNLTYNIFGLNTMSKYNRDYWTTL